MNQNYNEISSQTSQNGNHQNIHKLLINIGEGVENAALGGNINWYSLYGEQYRGFLKKLKMELPYDLAIPPQGIYPEKTII